MLTDDAAWSAMQARDARFDGVFFVGVRTTKVYCRPICRVRMPLRRNCTFHPSAARAEAAGFRPCLLCRPEQAPGTSRMDARTTLATNAAALLSTALAHGEPPRLAALARQLDVTDRHLRRAFEAHHGLPPIRWLTTQRLQLARHLLADTALPITEVAFASGFGSVRRMNAVFAETWRLTPGQLRAQARRRGVLTEGRQPVLTLGFRPPYDVAGVLAQRLRHAIAHVELVEPTRLRRTLELPHGRALAKGWVEVSFERTRLVATFAHSLAPALGALVQRLRRAFDLDADPRLLEPVAESFGANPGLRVGGAFDGFECAVTVVLGQQVSVAAARTLVARLVERLGAPSPTPWSERSRCFPRPSALVDAGVDAIAALGLPRARAEALVALAQALHSGRLDLDGRMPVDDARRALAALPGFGAWTVDTISLAALSWPDAFPAGDVALHRALGVRTAAQALEAVEPFQPWRAYVASALWNRAAAAKHSSAPEGST
jgi:AraC family transcriptional regulator, regulatory protein of adaptative response / DNA-3-methyladenine glycosylase II